MGRAHEKSSPKRNFQATLQASYAMTHTEDRTPQGRSTVCPPPSKGKSDVRFQNPDKGVTALTAHPFRLIKPIGVPYKPPDNASRPVAPTTRPL